MGHKDRALSYRFYKCLEDLYAVLRNPDLILMEGEDWPFGSALLCLHGV
jgi:hypothetical protein